MALDSLEPLSLGREEPRLVLVAELDEELVLDLAIGGQEDQDGLLARVEVNQSQEELDLIAVDV